jgi:SAM-dependent methyltransferase
VRVTKNNPTQSDAFSKSDAWSDDRLPPEYRKWRVAEQEYILSKIQPEDKVADFCCGDGRLIQGILSIASQYTGCDNDREAGARAHQVTKRFGERASICLMEFLEFGASIRYQDISMAMCLGNSLAALSHPVPLALATLSECSTREAFISVIRKGTIDIRREYYELQGVAYTLNESTEVFTSPIWGESRAFTAEELEAYSREAHLEVLSIDPIANLGFMLRLKGRRNE